MGTIDWAGVRDALPVLKRGIGYWNTGTAGPLSVPVQKAMTEQMEEEMLAGRTGKDFFTKRQRLANMIKQSLSRMFGGHPDEWALTHHTTEGINRVLWGYDWRRGDEVITGNLEHDGVRVPLAVLRHRRGVRIRSLDFGLGDRPEEMVQKIEDAIGPSTRLCILSHVAYTSGARLPLEKLTPVLHRHGVPLLVDGAQAAGSVSIDLNEWPVDYYALPGQKWLLGPEGTGALFVRRQRWGECDLSESGYESVDACDDQGYFLPARGAGRYQVGTRNGPALAGQQAALEWLQSLGMSSMIWRIEQLAGSLRELLQEMPEIELLTPANHAGLVTFRLEGCAAHETVRRLALMNQRVRSIDSLEAVRISVGFYHTEEEIAAWPQMLRACL